MKNFVIVSGNFTENGNFSGYDAFGTRLHIHKRQMEAAGMDTIEKVKFPFHAIGAVKQIGQLDENSEPKLNAEGAPVLVDRLTATSVFKTREELVNAHVDVATIDIDIKAAIAAKASTAGLTKEAVNALLAASI